jgi:hypothetical protein
VRYDVIPPAHLIILFTSLQKHHTAVVKETVNAIFEIEAHYMFK